VTKPESTVPEDSTACLARIKSELREMEALLIGRDKDKEI
jgi:hypothetical protein